MLLFCSPFAVVGWRRGARLGRRGMGFCVHLTWTSPSRSASPFLSSRTFPRRANSTSMTACAWHQHFIGMGCRLTNCQTAQALRALALTCPLIFCVWPACTLSQGDSLRREPRRASSVSKLTLSACSASRLRQVCVLSQSRHVVLQAKPNYFHRADMLSRRNQVHHARRTNGF